MRKRSSVRKSLIIITIICVILFVSACSSIGNSGTARDPPTDEEHQKGIKELSYVFHPNTPPPEMIQHSQEEIVITLKNQGAADIEQGVLSLITENSYIRTIGKNKYRFTADGKSKYNPEGETKQLRFVIESAGLNQQSQRHSIELLANVCYDYATELNEVVCIDPDPYSQKALDVDKVCEMQDVTSSGQGSPIVIDKVRIMTINEPGGQLSPTLFIHIRNKGNGVVVQSSRISDLCSGAPLRAHDMNRVSVYVSLADRDLLCDTNSIQLIKKEATIRCTDPIGIDPYLGTHQTPLHIKLTYGYSDTISKLFSIIR